MMSHELKEGTRIQRINLPDESRYVVGELGVNCMSIREQTGQMSMVPWVRVEITGTPDIFVNCALVESIEFAE
jgi:hypothetical protein